LYCETHFSLDEVTNANDAPSIEIYVYSGLKRNYMTSPNIIARVASDRGKQPKWQA